MKLTIGILTGETGRYSRFWDSFSQLKTPKNTHIITKLGVNIVQARNEIIRESKNSDFVWFIDDDHTFKPDLVENLMNRRVPVIQPLVLSRYVPFGPVMMGEEVEGKPGFYNRIALDNSIQNGIIEVTGVGAGGVLIRRDVINKIPDPWFDVTPNKMNEDVRFCEKVRAAGYKVFCDLDNVMGHLNVGSVTPVKKDGKWVTELMMGNGTYYLPAVEGKKK